MTDFDRVGERPPPTPTAVFLQVGLGIVLVFVLHAIAGVCVLGGSALATQVGGAGFLSMLSSVWMMGVGVVQVLYVGPVAVVAFFVRRPIALGMVIGAAITFVLQGACYGLVALTVFGAYAQS